MATLCILLATNAVAQNSSTLYGVTRIPQMNSVNPAFFPIHTKAYTSTFGLNVMGSFPMSLNELIRDTTVFDAYGTEQRYNLVDVNSIIDYLKENNQFNLGTDINLLGAGFKLGNIAFLTLGLQMQIDGHIGLPIEALNLITDGNVGPDSIPTQTVNLLHGDLLNFQANFGAAIGLGIKLKRLTLGVRAKPLLGLVDINTRNTYINLETDENINKVMATVHYNAQMALPLHVDIAQYDSPEELFNNLGNIVNGFSLSDLNWGLGVDLGAKYEILGFEFSASVLDLGGIRWNTVYNLQPRNGEGTFAFEGIDASDLINGGNINMDSIVQQYKDEAEELLDAAFVPSESYTTTLRPKFNIGAFYKVPIISGLGLTVRAGLLWHGELAPRMASLADAKEELLYQNLTAMASVNLFDWLELTVTNSVIHNGSQTMFINPGASVNIMLLNRFQFYALMDYGAFRFTDAKDFNFYIGTNMLFGRRKLLQFSDATPQLPQNDNYLL